MQSTVIQTFKRILAALLPNERQQNQRHHHLQRYVQALKPSNFAALLLNLVLGCPMVLYDLEQRLTSVFIAHEGEDLNQASWLIKFFEYMHLALTMNYRYLHTHHSSEEDRIPASIIIA
jgi:hypothetical protein